MRNGIIITMGLKDAINKLNHKKYIKFILIIPKAVDENVNGNTIVPLSWHGENVLAVVGGEMQGPAGVIGDEIKHSPGGRLVDHGRLHPPAPYGAEVRVINVRSSQRFFFQISHWTPGLMQARRTAFLQAKHIDLLIVRLNGGLSVSDKEQRLVEEKRTS